MKNKNLEDEIFVMGIIIFFITLCLIGLWTLILHERLPRIPCIFYYTTGLYCPGCGGTRACIALLHGHLIKALWYHPLVPYSVFMYIGFMMSHLLEKLQIPHIKGWKFHNWYLYTTVGLIVFQILEKNILHLCFGISI